MRMMKTAGLLRIVRNNAASLFLAAFVAKQLAVELLFKTIRRKVTSLFKRS
jgi:hypothetical protein